MGKLAVVVGNTGVGKTTLVQAISRQGNYFCATEDQEGGPFLELFSQDHQRYALANQLDFLLRRTDEEIEIRRGEITGIQDGGLEQDFHIYTRLFHQKGYLTSGEFDLCKRHYQLARTFLPAPELMIWLKASPQVIADRFQQRNRRLNIARTEDIAAIDNLLNSWLQELDPENLVVVDGEDEDHNYSACIAMIRNLLDA